MKLDSKKFRLVLIGLIGLSVIVFFALLYFGLSTLSQKSTKLADLKQQSQTADVQLENLKEIKKELAQYDYFKGIANTIIPNDKDQAQAVTDIFTIAKQSGFDIQGITFPP